MNKPFISIRWKLVSTYLLLVFLTLFGIESLVSTSLSNHMLAEKNNNMLSQGAILADQIAPYLRVIEEQDYKTYIAQTLKSYSLNINARVLLLNREGNVVLDSYDAYNGVDLKKIKLVEQALKGVSNSKLYRFDDIGQTVYTCLPVYYKGGVIGVILISSAPDDVYQRIDNILEDFYSLSIIAVVVSLILSLFLSNIFSKPILELTKVVRDVSSGKAGEKVTIYSNDELGVLSESMNLMVTRLTAVDDLRKQFVSNVSHELRTPITALKIIAQTMLDSKPQDVSVYEEFMADIDGELDRLNDIIDTLLNLTQLEQEDGTLNLSQTSLQNLIGQCVKTLKPIAKKKNIKLDFEIKGDAIVEIDVIRIRQCFINIIANGLKYNQSGGSVKVILMRNRDEALVKICDTGIGIPDEEIPYIFDRFYRVDEARARTTGGTGLGLAIAQQIMALHGGRIEVKSELNVGSEFTIFLPLRRRK